MLKSPLLLPLLLVALFATGWCAVSMVLGFWSDFTVSGLIAVLALGGVIHCQESGEW